VSTSIGINHCLAIDKGGNLWTWGGNAGGQLSDDTTIYSRATARQLCIISRHGLLYYKVSIFDVLYLIARVYMEEVIGKRQKIWHTILPLVVFVATTALVFIFRDWITESALGFLPERLAEAAYWVFATGLTVLSVWKNIEFFINIVNVLHIITMPRNLVFLGSRSITLAKAIKITEKQTQAAVFSIIESRQPPLWLSAKEINEEEIWDEDWYGRVEIAFDDIKAIAYLACAKRTKNLKRLLENAKDVRGLLIVVTNADEVFVQPKLQDLRTAQERLLGI